MHLLASFAIVLGGLQGTVLKGPTTPVCRVGMPCSAPVQVTLVFRRPGHVYRTRSAPDGRYRIRIPAGYYTVSTVERIGIRPNISPHAVHVRRGHLDKLDFEIDTGIR
ncbi:MAG TPA: carboxypeptidase-like regulatory domain-containing protein [Gaiellaceae bacterium]|nr:carboxypeptidase-like regulatory domain-containing protein [Gaiellaceae bacterium]